MFKRFTNIVNKLDTLGKTFSNEEKVRKVLRILPKLSGNQKPLLLRKHKTSVHFN